MREIVLDTETTGGNIKDGDRAIDIGLIEMVDGKRTGRTWQTYLNPEGRKSHWGALRVHGIKDDFLLDKPLFKDVSDDMLAFIDGAPCIAHSARFDRDVILSEFHKTGQEIPELRFYDSITLAKQCLSGGKFKLDALVERLAVTIPDRKFHGALLDSEILCIVLEELHARYPRAFDVNLTKTRPLDPLPAHLRHTAHDRHSTQPFAVSKPSEAPEAPKRGTMNEGVRENIAKINATTGSVGRDIARLMRTGGNDGFSSLSIKEAMAEAQKLFPKEDILQAFKDVGKEPEARGLRWMCRGVRPDRWAACKTPNRTLNEHYRPIAEVEARKPRKSPGALNPGVAERIETINATSGSVTLETYQLMRSEGSDGFSRYKAEDALFHAEKNFPKAEIVAAFEILGGAVDVAGLRWMGRGLRPDRWAACMEKGRELGLNGSRGKKRPPLVAREILEPRQEVDDTPGMDM